MLILVSSSCIRNMRRHISVSCSLCSLGASIIFVIYAFVSIEHGSLNDPSKATFTLTDEDHTLANSLRYILNKDPRVSFCGFSIPHPSDAMVNLRVQTTGDTAREVLVDSCQDLMFVCQHIRNTFDQAVTAFRKGEEVIHVEKQGEESMDVG